MEESSLTAAPSILDEDNYETWVVRMIVHLQALDVWEAVEENYEVPLLGAIPTVAQMKLHKERKTRKAKAKACLFAALQKIRSISRRNTNEMKESRTCKLLGKEFSNEKIVQKILVILPEKYEATISSLENLKDLSTISLTELLHSFEVVEQRRLMRQGDTVEGAFQARMQKNACHKNGKMNNNKPSNNNQKNGVFPPCPHCKKTNHSPQKCWICKNQQHEETSAAIDQCQEEQLFATTCFANKSTSESWLVDSGCTNHMTNNQDLFRELDRTAISKVKIGNGEYIPMKGKGTIAIESQIGLKLIYDVLFVPAIDQNLLILPFDLLGDEHATVLQQDSTTMLWHRRLRHFHHDVVLYMKKNQIVEGLPDLEKDLPKKFWAEAANTTKQTPFKVWFEFLRGRLGVCIY
uniref:Uncharacterized protein n=1 Tax=Vitis vinifera TaxID=29760 RepID=A5C1D2_VITVI|nr:hypothetical protein VITISV_026924 [Vitis vinifera]